MAANAEYRFSTISNALKEARHAVLGRSLEDNEGSLLQLGDHRILRSLYLSSELGMPVEAQSESFGGDRRSIDRPA